MRKKISGNLFAFPLRKRKRKQIPRFSFVIVSVTNGITRVSCNPNFVEKRMSSWNFSVFSPVSVRLRSWQPSTGPQTGNSKKCWRGCWRRGWQEWGGGAQGAGQSAGNLFCLCALQLIDPACRHLCQHSGQHPHFCQHPPALLGIPHFAVL